MISFHSVWLRCVNKAMFTLSRIAFAQALKPYRTGLLFTHKNNDFGAISVTERSCVAQISEVESRKSGRHSHYCWFARDVTAAMLVVKNNSNSLFYELNLIFI